MNPGTMVPPAAVVVMQEVADWNRWKSVFDNDMVNRKSAGMLGHHINRGHDNPNQVAVYLALSDVAKARAFVASDALKRAMAEAGVKGKPEMIWLTPVSESLVWDRELPAMMVVHPVADFARWHAEYKGAAGFQRELGVIGAAVNQLADDPSTVVVYHQAEKHESLAALAANPRLKAIMEKAGVKGPPRITFHTGGWGKAY